MAFKMMGKSPMMKKLIGKQKNLPAELKAKIMAAPESPAKMKKAPAKMAKDPAMKMKKAPTKMKKAPMKQDKVSYSDAYNKLKPTKSGGRYDEKNKKNYKSEAEFTAAAKAYNKKNYGTTEPTRDAKKKGVTKEELKVTKNIKPKKVTKVEVKTAKPEVKKVKANENVMEGKKTLGDTKLGNLKVGKNGKRLADTKIGKAFSKGRAKGVAERKARAERMAAAKAERIAKRKAKKDAKKNKK